MIREVFSRIIIPFLILVLVQTSLVAQTYIVTGRIVYSTTPTIGVANIPVRNTQTGQVLNTDSTGYYTFAEIKNGTYYLYPLQPGLEFEPLVRTLKVNDEDIALPDFKAEAATYSIHGKISYEKSPSIGVPGVTVWAGEGLEAVTDETGFFRIKNLRHATTYVIVPTVPDMDTKNIKFFPTKVSIIITGAIMRQNFSILGVQPEER